MAKDNETQTTGSLQDFSFDDNQDFFGIKTEENETEQIIKEVKGAEKITSEETPEGDSKGKTSKEKTEKLPDSKKDEEEDEVTFFETDEDKAKKTAKKEDKEDDEEEPEEEVAEDKKKDKPEEKKDKKEEEDDKFFTTLAGELKEKGIFQNVELKEGEEITEEKFFELQDAEIEKRVEETFEAFFEELDEDAKNFLRFKKSGGKTGDFFASYNSQFDATADFNIENDEERTRVLTHYLATVEHLEAEDIKDRLEWLKEGGKEKTYAKKYFDSMRNQAEKQKAAVVKQQEEAATAREISAKDFNESLETVLAKTENVGAFTFTKVDQKELGTYVTKPTVKVGKNKYVPAFQAEIANIFKADTEESKQKLLLLAKLVKTNFDVTDLVTETQTKVVKKAKSRLQEAKTGVKPSSAGNASKKSLGDYFG